MLTQIQLTIDNITIEQTDKTQFLGIIINQNLTWTDHFLLLNPLNARSRYTSGTVYKCHRQKPVYRRHGYQRHRPEAGIPVARLSTPQARSRYTVFVF